MEEGLGCILGLEHLEHHGDENISLLVHPITRPLEFRACCMCSVSPKAKIASDVARKSVVALNHWSEKLVELIVVLNNPQRLDFVGTNSKTIKSTCTVGRTLKESRA